MEERNERFSVPPATVYENMQNLEKYKNKLDSLKQGNVFTDAIIESFKVGAIKKWKKELSNRIIDDAMDSIRSYSKLHEKDILVEVNSLGSCLVHLLSSLLINILF